MNTSMDYNLLIAYALENFGLVMLALAIIIAILEWLGRKLFSHPAGAVVFYRWIALLAVGVTAIYAAFLHVFFADMAAKTIGWATSPFQYEVAAADFAMGLLAILSFRASFGFRVATVLATTCILWGDAIVHIHEIMTKGNFAIGNAGSWFWLDIILPVLLIICILRMRRESPKTYEPSVK